MIQYIVNQIVSHFRLENWVPSADAFSLASTLGELGSNDYGERAHALQKLGLIKEGLKAAKKSLAKQRGIYWQLEFWESYNPTIVPQI